MLHRKLPFADKSTVQTFSAALRAGRFHLRLLIRLDEGVESTSTVERVMQQIGRPQWRTYKR